MGELLVFSWMSSKYYSQYNTRLHAKKIKHFVICVKLREIRVRRKASIKNSGSIYRHIDRSNRFLKEESQNRQTGKKSRNLYYFEHKRFFSFCKYSFS
jgi:hypothetical protein